MAKFWTDKNCRAFIKLLKSGEYSDASQALVAFASQLGIEKLARSTARDGIFAYCGKNPSEIFVPRRKLAKASSSPPTSTSSDQIIGRSLEESFKPNAGHIVARGLDVKTLDKALEIAKVDLSVWKVERHVINSWEVTGRNKDGKFGTYTNWQVKAWLVRKSPQEASIEKLLSTLKKDAPKPQPLKYRRKKSDRLLEISIVDVHNGLRCQPPTAEDFWNPELSRSMLLGTSAALVSAAESCGPFDRIVVPIGHDWMHIDGPDSATTKGTLQPEADEYLSMFLAAEKLAIEWILSLREIAPVEIIVVPGNHDWVSAFALGRILSAYFHKDPHVGVDTWNNPTDPYKWLRWGCNLIGYFHKVKNPLAMAALMANERPQDWAETAGGWREWHVGDQHRRGEYRPFVMEEQGVGIEFQPSIVPSNAWARSQGYTHQRRSGTAHVWDKEEGQIARFVRLAREIKI